METCLESLTELGYHNVKDQASVLFPGEDRFQLLEWILNRLSAGTDLGSVFGDVGENVEEELRIQRLSDAFTALGLKASKERVRGSGHSRQGVSFLCRIVNVLSAMEVPDVPNCSLEDQSRRESALIGSIAAKQSEIFLRELELFPMDMNFVILANKCDLSQISEKLSGSRVKLAEVKLKLAEFDSEKAPEDSDETSLEDVVMDVQTELENFLQIAAEFKEVFHKDMRAWMNSVQKPQMEGLGPAALRCLAGYNRVNQVLEAMQSFQLAENALLHLSGEEKEGVVVHSINLSQIVDHCETLCTESSNALRVFSIST
mmetsp:Transcript_22547/g.31387  ORF Transcript_22547/g.31387 Transcript_22547/m.31387 type:complete len:316 (+) Transcript_22547:56-1003(+)